LIKDVLFDLDETLLDRDTTVEAYLKDQCRRCNLNHVPFRAYRDRFRELDEHGYADKQKAFQTLIMEFDLSASIEESVADFRQNAWRDCKTFPDAEGVLRQLRTRGYRLGIVTNGSVLLVNSCARSKATRDSCLDLVVLAKIEYYNSSSHVSPIKS
jgi:putative hydrolase of the HAD superfamily